jgi:hypothetical protein
MEAGRELAISYTRPEGRGPVLPLTAPRNMASKGLCRPVTGASSTVMIKRFVKIAAL